MKVQCETLASGYWPDIGVAAQTSTGGQRSSCEEGLLIDMWSDWVLAMIDLWMHPDMGSTVHFSPWLTPEFGLRSELFRGLGTLEEITFWRPWTWYFE